jgi:hypothetical protein
VILRRHRASLDALRRLHEAAGARAAAGASAGTRVPDPVAHEPGARLSSGGRISGHVARVVAEPGEAR